MALPIYQVEDEIVNALDGVRKPRLVVEAPTGSGKSTQVPQMLVDRDCLLQEGQIVVLQPRRVAARMLARRVASERRGQVGDEVGYQVRFENFVGPKTRIRYVTEGVLLRQILEDPELKGISAIVFDEFHERHFFGDITLARARRIQEETRPDLALIVMSATLDGDALTKWLGEGCARVTSEGRTFPVEIQYEPPRERVKGEIWDHIVPVYTAHVKASGETPDALIFLPGVHEIRKTIDAFRQASWARHMDLLPLYGELSPKEQDRALTPSEKPRVIVATNVAETSLTIDGIRLVIDAGLARMASFDVRRGINTLTVEKISRASADQRAGRAGRTAAGTCIRLWSEADHAQRPEQTPPEIHRMDLSEVVLTLKVSGIEDLETFEWFEEPDRDGLERAHSLLREMGALEEDGSLTERGRQMARFPVTPRYARVLLEAARHGVFDAMTEIVAMTQGKPLFVRRKRRSADLTKDDFVHPGDVSDFQPALRGLATARDNDFRGDVCGGFGIQGRAAREIDRLASLLQRHGPGRDDQDLHPELLARCLLTGFLDQVAVRLNRANRACAVVGGRRGRLADDSCVEKSDLFIAAEIHEIEGREVNVLLNQCTGIERSLLEELFSNAFSSGTSAQWNEQERRVVAREVVRYRDLDLESKAATDPPEDEAAAILARQIQVGNLVLKKWDASVEHWIARLNTLAEALPDYELPSFGEEDKLAILEQICLGAMTYKQVKDRSVLPELKRFLAPHQRPLIDRLAPERLDLPNGKRGRIRYETGSVPTLSAQLQHLYDITEHPSLADGRIPLKVEILAPNQRPVQVTEDLPAFWDSSYAAVKKDLRGRYPKHEWR